MSASVLIVLMETKVMLSFSPLAVLLLSDTTESSLFLPLSSGVLHRPFRLTTVTKTTMTIISIKMRLITPKATMVRLLLGGCVGRRSVCLFKGPSGEVTGGRVPSAGAVGDPGTCKVCDVVADLAASGEPVDVVACEVRLALIVLPGTLDDK